MDVGLNINIMTEEFIKKNLDYDGYIAYQNGSEKFRQAVRIGLAIQLSQVNLLLKRLGEKLK